VRDDQTSSLALLKLTLQSDAADAESPLKPDELAVLRQQFEKEGEYAGIQTKFNYAWVLLFFYPSCFRVVLITAVQGLIKSSDRGEQQFGVQLLSDIFRSSPDRRRECLYYLALGHYKLGNYSEARRYNDLLLDLEPGNLQAASLRGLIEERVQRDGLVGVAIVGGLAVAAGVVGSLLMRRRKR
jgi:fission 1 protein